MLIAEYLLPGKAAAIPVRDLITMTGLTRREIAELVEHERRAGTPICSGNTGMYIGATAEEIEESAATLNRKGLGTLMAANALSRAAKRMREQEQAEKS